MVEVPVGHYRYSDDGYELPKTRSIQSDPKARRQKFSIHHVQTVIEQMDVDSDESTAPDDVATKSRQTGTHSSTHVAAATHTGSNKENRKSRSNDRHNETDSSEVDNDLEDVEPDDSQDDFINQVTTKLQTFATDLGTDSDAENHGRGASTSKNKLSLKKTRGNASSQECTDSKDRLRTTMKQKPTATKLQNVTPTGNMDPWDIIESLSDSNSGDESELLDIPPTFGQHRSVEAKTPKQVCKIIPSDTDKRKQTPVGQLDKSGSRLRKNLKYCKPNDLLQASEETTVEEYKSDAGDEDFLSLASNSPAAVSVTGRTTTKKLTSSFWLTSPESRKSVYNMDDDEFVSNSSSYKHSFVVTWFYVCCSHFHM